MLPYIRLCICFLDHGYVPPPPGYRIVYMIMNVAHHILFVPPRIIHERGLKELHRFLQIKFDSKRIGVVNIRNFLSHITVQSYILIYINMISKPCISYRYTSTIASKLYAAVPRHWTIRRKSSKVLLIFFPLLIVLSMRGM
jgi:hypothetical protein